MSPPQSQDLRASRRAPLRLRVDYQKMNDFFADYTRNISKGGTFIKTRAPLAIGTRCAFAMSLPALSDPLLLDGEVAWVRTENDAAARSEEPGMGIRFVFADEQLRGEFEELVSRMMEESLGPQIARGLLGRR